MDSLNVVAIIQARMASSRLPGKILKDLGHKPVLGWMIARVRRANLVSRVVIATTRDDSDDPVANYCLSQEVAFSRGSMHDVLDRYYQAATHFKADVIVRLTADCPFIDPILLDSNIETFMLADPPLAFAANRLPNDRTVPIGLDTEICTYEALQAAWNEADEPHHREHVMPYLYENAERFPMLHMKYQEDHGNLRWTVDTPEDLALLREIVKHFPGQDDFRWLDVLAVVQENPELMEINAEVKHKDYREVDDRA